MAIKANLNDTKRAPHKLHEYRKERTYFNSTLDWVDSLRVTNLHLTSWWGNIWLSSFSSLVSLLFSKKSLKGSKLAPVKVFELNWGGCQCCDDLPALTFSVFTLFLPAALLTLLLQCSEGACTSEGDCRNVYLSTSRRFIRIFWNVTEVPQDIPADALEVDLHNNSIASLSAGAFMNLTDCKQLNLVGNQISTIEEAAFRGLVSLESLGLSSNRIYALETGMFIGLNNLIMLYLASNEMSYIGENAFSGLESLKHLDLDQNKFSVLETKMFAGLTVLTSLWLQNNQISHIEELAFVGLESLDTLGLTRNNFSVLYSEMFRGLNKLTWLDLQNNKISSIEKNSFLGLESLLFLFLHHNKISVLPQGVFSGLRKLKALPLPGNQINHIDTGAFDSLDSLETLFLHSNRLTTLSPQTLLNLPRNPLLLALSRNPFSNKWNCSSLCWLKQEEQHGTVTWYIRSGNVHHPRCAEGQVWTSLPCGKPGKSNPQINSIHWLCPIFHTDDWQMCFLHNSSTKRFLVLGIVVFVAW